jgi:hypothetical protein
MTDGEPTATPKSLSDSAIGNLFDPIRLLPGESAEAYLQGLRGTIKELGAATELQRYLAEKIFQCLWWMRRYETQKEFAAINAMVDLLATHGTSKEQRYALTASLQVEQWSRELLKVIRSAGYTSESLLAKALTQCKDEIQKIDSLIAWRVKALSQLQQSYEALANRTVMAERLKLQNELLRRDLRAIESTAVKASVATEINPHDYPKTKGRKS